MRWKKRSAALRCPVCMSHVAGSTRVPREAIPHDGSKGRFCKILIFFSHILCPCIEKLPPEKPVTHNTTITIVHTWQPLMRVDWRCKKKWRRWGTGRLDTYQGSTQCTSLGFLKRAYISTETANGSVWHRSSKEYCEGTTQSLREGTQNFVTDHFQHSSFEVPNESYERDAIQHARILRE